MSGKGWRGGLGSRLCLNHPIKMLIPMSVTYSDKQSFKSTCSIRVTQDHYRGALQNFLIKVPVDSSIDCREAVLAADRVHRRSSGRVSSRAFLITRHSLLDGKTPLEVLSEPDGARRIRRLVDVVVADFA